MQGDESFDINEALKHLDEDLTIEELAGIKDAEHRLSIIEGVLTQVAGGNLWVRIPIDTDHVDRLTALETGINLILSDLEDETNQKMRLAEEIKNFKRG